jgi:hypothetical protein
MKILKLGDPLRDLHRWPYRPAMNPGQSNLPANRPQFECPRCKGVVMLTSNDDWEYVPVQSLRNEDEGYILYLCPTTRCHALVRISVPPLTKVATNGHKLLTGGVGMVTGRELGPDERIALRGAGLGDDPFPTPATRPDLEVLDPYWDERGKAPRKGDD